MKSPYSTNYAEARAQFIEAARANNATVESYRLSQAGPTGEELATDTAWVGTTTAKKVLVTTSATHGVEGYFGSATQVEWLRRAKDQTLPQDVAALHIHAINPYGFAWMRRANEDNVDINRNWINFDLSLPLKGVFHSDDALWQGMALGQGLAACRAALSALSEDAHPPTGFPRGVRP
jgi:Protein of unknown function (DUF2817)